MESMQTLRTLFHLTPAILCACTSVPTGPSVMVLPGSHKDFSQFTGDDAQCRQFALQQSNGRSPSEAAAVSGIGAAAVGTAVGAAAGATMGGGSGAAIGAGVGLAGGSMVGAGIGSSVGSSAQERYDAGYIQCMYSQGHRVPVFGDMQTRDTQSAAGPTHPPSYPNLPLPPGP